MAEEKGATAEEFLGDAKMDKLMDAIMGASGKLDGLGARMDAADEERKADRSRLDETCARMDALAPGRKDAAEEEDKKEDRKDASKKDGEGDKKEPSPEPKEPVGDKKDAAEEKSKEDDKMDGARMDSVNRELADVRGMIERVTAQLPKAMTDADRERFAAIQERADPAFQAFGDSAPRPLEGETPLTYESRLATKMQNHSAKWKGKRLTAVADADILDGIATEIYQDAIKAARRGAELQPGQLREHRRETGTGHIIVEFEGDPATWMDRFSGPAARSAGNWNTR